MSHTHFGIRFSLVACHVWIFKGFRLEFNINLYLICFHWKEWRKVEYSMEWEKTIIHHVDSFKNPQNVLNAHSWYQIHKITFKQSNHFKLKFSIHIRGLEMTKFKFPLQNIPGNFWKRSKFPHSRGKSSKKIFFDFLLILFETFSFERLITLPLNLWLHKVYRKTPASEL